MSLCSSCELVNSLCPVADSVPEPELREKTIRSAADVVSEATMEANFITEDGVEVTMLPRMMTQQRLGGAHEVFDHDCFDFDILQPVANMQLRWNRTVRVGKTIFFTIRFFLSVSSLVIAANQVSSSASTSTIDSMGTTGFKIVSYCLQFFPALFLFVMLLQFNSYFSELVYYRYLERGAIVDFPETADQAYLFSHRLPVLFLVVFGGFTIFCITMLIIFSASLSNFVLVVTALLGVSTHWYSQQAVEDKLISLSEFIQSFPDADGAYGNIDRISLAAASDCLRSLTLLEGRLPSYDSYWRRSYFKSIFAETRTRVIISLGLRIVVLLVVGALVVYVYFVLTIQNVSVWEGRINPCVEACAFDDTLKFIAAPRCSNCLCRCLSAFQVKSCDCTRLFSVSNCSVSACASCLDAAARC